MLFALLRDGERRPDRPAGGAALPDRRDPGGGARLRRGRRRPRRRPGRRRAVGHPVSHQPLPRRLERHVLVLGHARSCPARRRGATASPASRRGRASSTATAAPSPTTTCTSITSRSRRARRARRCCCSGSRPGRCRPSRSSSPATSTPAKQPGAARAGRSGRPRRGAGGRSGAAPPFVDTFRALHRDEKEVGSFSNFVVRPDDGREDRLRAGAARHDGAVSAGIVRTSADGRYPSDHFPVVARDRAAALVSYLARVAVTTDAVVHLPSAPAKSDVAV